MVSLAINRLAAEPSEAFGAARDATRGVRDALRACSVPDAEVRSSEITLQTQYRHVAGASEFIGHRATVEITVSLTDLTKLESVLVGSVGAGADQVRSVQFKTLRLRELRAQARRAAAEAARAKATLYADALGVKLGKVLHVEDVDPTMMARREHSHVVDQGPPDDEVGVGVYDPGTIAVSGTVVVSFAIL